SIIGAGLLPSDARMGQTLRAQDGLYTLIERDDSLARAAVIGSISDYVYAADDARSLLQVLADPGTHIVSLTITESGYPVKDGELVESARVAEDARSECPSTVFGVIAFALDARRRVHLPPFTVMSCDNLPANGDVTRAATIGAAATRSATLAEWVNRRG